MSEGNAYRGVDLAKLVMALLVVAIHAGFFTDIDGGLAFVIIQVFARMGVPFFFIASGFFFSKGLAKRPGGEAGYLRSYVAKLLGMFAFWCLVMLPFWTRNLVASKGFGPTQALILLRTVLFDPGVFWYLEALVVCALVSWPFLKRGREGILLALGAVCYVFGMFGDSYYGLVKDLPILGDLYRAYFTVFVHVRKGLPFGLLFFATGTLLARREDRLGAGLGPLGVALATALGLRGLELALVSKGGFALDNSVSLFVAPPAILAFLIALRASPRIDDAKARDLRSMSSTLFFSHQFMLELVILFVRYTGIGIGGTLRWVIAVLLCLALWKLASARGPAFLRRMLNC